jgi:hypothetical protein
MSKQVRYILLFLAFGALVASVIWLACKWFDWEPLIACLTSLSALIVLLVVKENDKEREQPVSRKNVVEETESKASYVQIGDKEQRDDEPFNEKNIVRKSKFEGDGDFRVGDG